ncbi:MAG TPA: hypothetical protein VF740_14835 [Candidatus Acidoferrum sp.]
MMTCDLCGKEQDCLQKEIDAKEYDICFACWELLAQKLKGKGREKLREMVLLPPRTIKEREEKETETPPGSPPVIQGEVLVL